MTYASRLIVAAFVERNEAIRLINASATGAAMSSAHDELREEYDFSQGERGKYSERYAQGSNVVVLEPDVAERFRSSEEVNEALRKIAKHALGE